MTSSYSWLDVNMTTGDYGADLKRGDVFEEENARILSPAKMQQTPFIESRIGMFLLTYIMPIIIFSGTIGNCISFIVLLRKRMRVASVYFYMVVLAVADTCVLYLSSFKTWLRLLTGFEMLHVSDCGCKIVMFLFLVAIHMSGWLIVLMTLDRFIVVWAPFEATRFCSIARARIVTLLLTLVSVSYCLHIFWTVHLNVTTDGSRITKQCEPEKDDYFMNHIFPYMKLASYSIVPFIIVFTLNVAIIFKITQTTGIIATRRNLNKGIKSQSEIYKRHRVTYMLLTVSIMWLLLTGPFTIWSLVPNTATDPHSLAKSFLSKVVCFMLMYLNHSINFWLYCVTGVKFRRELKVVLCYMCGQQGLMRHRSTRTLRTPLVKTNSPAEQCALVAMSKGNGVKSHSSNPT